MSIPRPIRKLPIRSIFAVAVMKMCLMPVLGVLLVEGLVKGGLVNSNDRVLRFTLVCAFKVFRTTGYEGPMSAQISLAFRLRPSKVRVRCSIWPRQPMTTHSRPFASLLPRWRRVQRVYAMCLVRPRHELANTRYAELAGSLIVQYAFLLLTGTITTAYTLSKLF